MSQLTSPNQFIEATNGVRYAYRRFGCPGRTPLLMLPHFRGNLDSWDPALIDALAEERELILLDNAGVGLSSGASATTITGMAHDALAFTDAMGLTQLDVLGFSLGGYIAQELATIRPTRIRRLVLAGTGPRGGYGMHGLTPAVHAAATREVTTPQDILFLFFPADRYEEGTDFLKRLSQRADDKDQPVGAATHQAQLDAATAWGTPDHSALARLTAIHQPALIANGNNDLMVPTRNSYLLAGHLPNAHLKIFPHAGHGFLFQEPAEFAADILCFLHAPQADTDVKFQD